MELITVDIGNSNVSVAAFVKGELQSREDIGVGELGKLTEVFTRLSKVCLGQSSGSSIVPVVCSSVNPEALKTVREGLLRSLNQDLLVAGQEF